jgi:hypothetical protein
MIAPCSSWAFFTSQAIAPRTSFGWLAHRVASLVQSVVVDSNSPRTRDVRSPGSEQRDLRFLFDAQPWLYSFRKMSIEGFHFLLSPSAGAVDSLLPRLLPAPQRYPFVSSLVLSGLMHVCVGLLPAEISKSEALSQHAVWKGRPTYDRKRGCSLWMEQRVRSLFLIVLLLYEICLLLVSYATSSSTDRALLLRYAGCDRFL